MSAVFVAVTASLTALADCDGNVLDDCGVCDDDNVIANDLCENAEFYFLWTTALSRNDSMFDR